MGARATARFNHSMPHIVLRPIDRVNFKACIDLRVAEEQEAFVAPNVYSLAQAKVNPRLQPWAIYGGEVFARKLTTDDPMVGFVMFQISDEVAFITRLMIDHRFQRRGYGRAAMLEVVRRLKLHPDVQFIGTSVHKENPAALELYRSLGFVDHPKEDPRELYLKLPWEPVA